VGSDHRTAVARSIERDRRLLVVVPFAYAAMIVWSIFAVGRAAGPAILVPATLAAGAWIFVRVTKRMRRARAALAGEIDLEAFHAEQVEEAIRVKRRMRWVAPLLVAVSMGGAIVVVGKRGNLTYWIGGALVSAILVGAALHSNRSLRRHALR
jgi:hypothetical protein